MGNSLLCVVLSRLFPVAFGALISVWLLGGHGGIKNHPSAKNHHLLHRNDDGENTQNGERKIFKNGIFATNGKHSLQKTLLKYSADNWRVGTLPRPNKQQKDKNNGSTARFKVVRDKFAADELQPRNEPPLELFFVSPSEIDRFMGDMVFDHPQNLHNHHPALVHPHSYFLVHQREGDENSSSPPNWMRKLLKNGGFLSSSKFLFFASIPEVLDTISAMMTQTPYAWILFSVADGFLMDGRQQISPLDAVSSHWEEIAGGGGGANPLPFSFRWRWNQPHVYKINGKKHSKNQQPQSSEALVVSVTAFDDIFRHKHLCAEINAKIISATNALDTFERCFRLIANRHGNKNNNYFHSLLAPTFPPKNNFRLKEGTNFSEEENVEKERESYFEDKIQRKLQKLREYAQGDDAHFDPLVGAHLPPLTNRFHVPVWEFLSLTFKQKGDGKISFTVKRFHDGIDENVEEKMEENGELDDVLATLIKSQQPLFKHPKISLLTKKANIYRSFSPDYGIRYIVDVVVNETDGKDGNGKGNGRTNGKRGTEKRRRFFLSRPIYASTLIESVPFVREDTDLTVIVPLKSLSDLEAFENGLLQRHCQAFSPLPSPLSKTAVKKNQRNTRIVLVAFHQNKNGGEKGSEATMLEHRIQLLINRANKSCKALLLNSSSERRFHLEHIQALPTTISTEAGSELAEAVVSRFGPHLLYLWAPPNVDYQPDGDFLDRLALHTIRGFQVFAPIPFAAFNPVVTEFSPSSGALPGNNETEQQENQEEVGKGNLEAGAKRLAKLLFSEEAGEHPETVSGSFPQSNSTVKNEEFVINRNRGLFDPEETGVIAFYGSDLLLLLAKESGRDERDKKEKQKEKSSLDDEERIERLFLGVRQNRLHVFRAIEPSLRLNYRRPDDDENYYDGDLVDEKRRKWGKLLGTRAQLARLLFTLASPPQKTTTTKVV